MNRSGHNVVYSRVVDLSQPIRPGMPLWPGDPEFRAEPTATVAGEGYFLRRFCMGEHSGTHLVTPSGYDPDGQGPDEISPAQLVGPAAVLDVRVWAASDADYALSKDDIAEWERRHGAIPSGAWVLLNTGWHRRWGDPERFINMGEDGAMHTPGFGLEAVRFLLDQRNVIGFGTDTHGVDPGRDAGLSSSRTALEQGALILECLGNLDQLPARGATLVAGRLPLEGGSGSPAGVLALVP